MESPVPPLADRASRCAEFLFDAGRVRVVSHADADGVTSAAIAARALDRAGVPRDVTFEDRLDDDRIAAIADDGPGTVLFTDFGSGQLDAIAARAAPRTFEPVVVDHHQPADVDFDRHLNPLLEGIDGASDLSGAGATYLLARALAAASGAASGATGDNRDLAGLAVVGAVGDVQGDDGGLTGANTSIAAEGEAAGVLATATDLDCFGRQTRPLPELLAYADVRVPGVTTDAGAARAFLNDLPVECRRADAGTEAAPDGTASHGWRRWVDLDDGERQRVASALLQRAVRRGVSPSAVESLIGTSYTLVEEPVGTALRDASEYATLLNATARYDAAAVGLDVCLGDRDGALERARELLRTHRRNISTGIDHVRDAGVERADNLQWFHAGDAIRPTVVGIVAGMALGIDGVDPRTPILAFAADDDGVKVSARGTGRAVGEGLDLGAVMREAAAAVGGEGGGHDVAAGATIPEGTEDAFVGRADALIGAQVGG